MRVRAAFSDGRGPAARVFFVAAAVAALCACRGRKERLVGTAKAAAVVDAGAVAAAATDAGAVVGAACPAVDPAKIAPFAYDRNAIRAELPPIVDEKNALAPFYDRALGLARGGAKRHLRIGVYGDSNLTSDHLTGHLRRSLQERFGDAGHGFVALARPWAWYRHEDVRHQGTWPLFKQIACTTDPVFAHRYGFANIAAESRTGGATIYVKTAEASAPVGRAVSSFDVYFLKQPKGGSFDLLLDGKVVRTVSTAAADFEAGYERVEAPDAEHELKVVVKGDGIVRFYGVTLERPAAPASFVVDSLGTGSLNFQRFLLGEPTLRRAQLEHRHYDLVMVWLGMNSMWLEPNRAWIRDTIAAIRSADPELPVLLLTPPDSVKPGETKTDPRILGVVKQLREVAAESGVAFWDFREAMGGEGAYLDFLRRGLAANDRAHLSPQASALMAQRLAAALFRGVAARHEARPDAGCGVP